MWRPRFRAPGLKVGLLGGSFNPAHRGHLVVSRGAQRSLGLDRVWWLVSPQNPLKSEAGMAPFEARLQGARDLVARERASFVEVSSVEDDLATSYTIDTIRGIRRRFPELDFVWLMGADNLVQFPRWRNWHEIAGELPIAVYPRPGYTLKARVSPAAQTFAGAFLDAGDAKLLPDLAPPAFVMLEGPQDPISATAIRAGMVGA